MLSSINWWPGSLRPYESCEGFLARFCALNGISPEKTCQFFGSQLPLDSRPSPHDLNTFARKLGEHPDIVNSMYWSDCGLWNFNLPWGIEEKPIQYIQYCSECLKLGYHSCLHKLRWVVRCPFHGKELCQQPVGLGAGKWDVRRVRKVLQLLSLQESEWRAGDDNRFGFESAGEGRTLVSWLDTVKAASRELQGKLIWESDPFYVANDITLADLVGQLHGLAPMPDKLQNYCIPFEHTWRLQKARFEAPGAAQLAKATKTISVNKLFHLYKQVVVASDNASPFKQALAGVRKRLSEEHIPCQCTWGIPENSATAGWIGRNSDSWPCCYCICPYERIIKTIELAAGVIENPPTSQNKYIVQCTLCNEVSQLFQLGLVSFIAEPSLIQLPLPPPHSDAYRCSRTVWPCADWTDSSTLTDLLDCMARFDLEGLLDAALRWLSKISRDVPPQFFSRPPIQLRYTEDGSLVLYSWRRPVGSHLI